MKNVLFIILFFVAITSFAQKGFFVQPKWQKNEQIQLTATKFVGITNDTLNQISNFKINIKLTILDKDKTGYVAKVIYSDLQKIVNHNQVDSEIFVLNYLQNQEIKVKLNLFGRPLGILNLNQVDTKLEKEFLKLAENPETQNLSELGFQIISQKKYAENYILKMLKVYCISTEREVIENKNYNFFKAHENSRAKGVVSFKAYYSLKKNTQNPNLHDLNFIINYDKISLEQVAQNHEFVNPNHNNVLLMKGENYNLIDLKSGQILQATDTWDIKYQNFYEKVQYQIQQVN